MKKSYLLFVFIILINLKSSAQNNVLQRIFNEPYNRLSNAWHEQPLVKYDSNFNYYYELPFNFLFNQVSGNIITMHGPSYVSIYDTTNVDIEIATFYPYWTNKLVDKSDLTGSLNFQSKLLTKIDTNNNEQIFKIEWRNMGFVGCTANDSLNMQLWIFEKSNKVQFRFGESNMSNLSALITTDTPIIAFDLETTNGYYFGAFNGPANNLVYSISDPKSRVLGIPPNGTVIEFVGADSPTIIDHKKNSIKFNYSITNNQLVISRIDNKFIDQIEIDIIDLNGRNVIKSNSASTNISQLKSGIYIVKFHSDLNYKYFKIKL